MFSNSYFTTVTRECLLNGVMHNYDVCSTSSLKEAKNYYGDRFTHIGSSCIYFINGTKNTSEKMIHFFVRNK